MIFFFSILDRLNQLEMNCIDLLQPIDMISMERHIQHMCKIESSLNLMVNNKGIKKKK